MHNLLPPDTACLQKEEGRVQESMRKKEEEKLQRPAKSKVEQIAAIRAKVCLQSVVAICIAGRIHSDKACLFCVSLPR